MLDDDRREISNLSKLYPILFHNSLWGCVGSRSPVAHALARGGTLPMQPSTRFVLGAANYRQECVIPFAANKEEAKEAFESRIFGHREAKIRGRSM
jgi:hypothetical protein